MVVCRCALLQQPETSLLDIESHSCPRAVQIGSAVRTSRSHHSCSSPPAQTEARFDSQYPGTGLVLRRQRRIELVLTTAPNASLPWPTNNEWWARSSDSHGLQLTASPIKVISLLGKGLYLLSQNWITNFYFTLLESQLNITSNAISIQYDPKLVV